MCKEYINLQTGEKLDLNILDGLKDNSALKVKPDIWIEWDFEKNKILGLDVFTIGKSNKQKINLICPKCTSEYYIITQNKVLKNQKCSYCSSKKVNHTNSLFTKYPELSKEWLTEKNLNLTPNNVTHGSTKIVWWKCNTCGSDYQCSIANRSNGKSCSYCYGNKVNETNSLITTHPELLDIWDYHKNSILPDEIRYGSHKLIHWKCKNCSNEFESVIWNVIKSKSKCPYCANKRISKTNNLQYILPDIAKEWHPIKNGKLLPSEVFTNDSRIVWWMSPCGHEWDSRVTDRVGKNVKCPYCNGKRVKVGYNAMITTNPNMSKLLLNPDDGEIYTDCSGKKVDWKCINCGNIILNRKISEVKRKGLCCVNCSDGVSYPEKLMYSLLTKKNIDFKHDVKVFKKFNYRYDFVIPKLKLIIEMHGLQHYDNVGFSKLSGKGLLEQIETDNLKLKIANDNGYNLITIDSRKSDLKFIRDNIINSELSGILSIIIDDFDDLNINYSIYLNIKELSEQGASILEISKKLKLHDSTIRRYLKKIKN